MPARWHVWRSRGPGCKPNGKGGNRSEGTKGHKGLIGGEHY